MSSRPRTLMEFLNTARDYLQAKGVDNPRGDAESLLSVALQLPRLELFLQHDRPLKQNEISAYRDLISRRGKREPLQFILGTVEFAGIQIHVSPGLLIPRPETEELAELVIEWALKEPARPLRILDIGTGTGCLAIAVAARVPKTTVDAIDDDFDAVRCAAANAEQNHVADRVQAKRVDFLSARFIESIQQPYDIVMSNPPYIAEKDYSTLAPEIRHHESKHALVSEEDGLRFYRRTAELLPDFLRPGGLLALEVGYNQATQVTTLMQTVIGNICVKNDFSGIPRIVSGTKREEQLSQLPAS